MPFSMEWEQLYKANKHWRMWPWSDLVTYVKRYGKLKPGDPVLELGCGVGTNIPFFLSLEVDYHGIDGSQTAIQAIEERFGGRFPNVFIQKGDFTQTIPLSHNGQMYKLIVDRAGVIHNTLLDITQTIKNVDQVLVPDGRYIGIDWFATSHSSCKGPNPMTLENPTSGPFTGVGVVHFTNYAELESLWQSWEIIVSHLKVDTKISPAASSDLERIASYDFVVQRS